MATQIKNKDSLNDWKVAKLTETKMAALDVKSLVFSVKDRDTHVPGQHYEIALTSTEGYRAVRNYSIASEPGLNVLEFGIQLIKEGEVSPYLFEMELGEEIEIRGPLGGHFNWDITKKGPLIMIAGGSGVVPFMSMLRHYLKRHTDDNRDIVLIVSAKSLEKLPYKDELDEIRKNYKNIKIFFALTQEFVPNPNHHKGRIDLFLLKQHLEKFLQEMPMIYVCGTNSFVETITEDLVGMGFNSHEIKTERFN